MESTISPLPVQEPVETPSTPIWPPRLWTKRSGLVIVALFIFVQLAAGIAVVVGVIAQAGGILALLETGAEGLEMPAWTSILSIAGSVVAHAGSVLLIGMLIKRHSLKDLGFRPMGKVWLAITAGLTLMMAVLRMGLAAGVTILWPDLATLGLDSLEDTIILREGAGYTMLILLLSAVVVPVAEELFFRGFVYNLLRNRWGVWLAATVSALIFGVAHLIPLQALLASVLGFVLALVYERSKSLWPPILIHALNNLIFVGIAYLVG